MDLATEVQAYKGVRCQPKILLFEEGVATGNTLLKASTQTIEVLKEEGENFIAIILAVDSSPRMQAGTRPLATMLKAMPRELWYVSCLEIAGTPEVIVAHRGIEGETLKELCYIYDRNTNQLNGMNAQKSGRLTHTVDIDLLIINPELWERITQAEQEGA
jgi:hypothetical protein